MTSNAPRDQFLSTRSRRLLFGLAVVLAGVCLVASARMAVTGSRPTPPSGDRASAAYPYGSASFTRLIADSFAIAGEGSPQGFYRWMETTYRASSARLPGAAGKTLEAALRHQRARLSKATRPADRARVEADIGAWTHRLVKSMIPRFSLERGFEFLNVLRYGERQCFLQSVLIAGLLQATGCEAGVAMVYQNGKGEVSNNGHAVALLRLADGTALIVDASDAEPFAKHQGLLVRAPDYHYVNPVYGANSDHILRYRLPGRQSEVTPRQVAPLDLRFIDSQFWYYRGERAPGGILAAKRTAAGLRGSAKGLSRAVKTDPRNALAVYMLGRVRWYQGDQKPALKLLTDAHRLYAAWGWVPPGVDEALGLASSPVKTAAGGKG